MNLWGVSSTIDESHLIVARYQNAISFGAGKREGLAQGRKEVVEWVETNELGICGYTGSKGSITGSEKWQAFKESLRQELPKE